MLAGPDTGILGMAFHPNFLANRRYYVYHHVRDAGSEGAVIVERLASEDYRRDAGVPSRRLVHIRRWTVAHTGGVMVFGPSGLLYVGVGDGHSIELIEYMRPRGEKRSDQYDRNRPGSAHAAMVVDSVPEWRERLEAEGIKTFGPKEERDLEYPWARYAIYFQDPDGNWLEMISRNPKPADSKEN